MKQYFKIPMKILTRAEAIELLFDNEDEVAKTEQIARKEKLIVVNRRLAIEHDANGLAYYDLDFENAEIIDE